MDCSIHCDNAVCIASARQTKDYGIVVWVGGLVMSMINPLNREVVMEVCFTFMVEMGRCHRM